MEIKKIKKQLLLIMCSVIFCGIFFSAPICSVLGADDFDLNFDSGGILGERTDLGNTDPATITYSVVNYALLFLGLITVIMIIISGFMWIFAAGNEERIKKAQDIMKGAILGLLVVMVSYGVAQYVFDKLVEITKAP